MKFLMKWGKKLEFNDFVMLKTRFYWIIKTKTENQCFNTRVGSCNFQPWFRGGLVIFVPKGRGPGYGYISKFSGPLPHIIFNKSLIKNLILLISFLKPAVSHLKNNLIMLQNQDIVQQLSFFLALPGSKMWSIQTRSF